MSDYPEHEKLTSRRAEHEAVVDFLNFCEDSGIMFHRLSQYQPYQTMPNYDDLAPARLIEIYFGVSGAELEREKRLMLTALR